MGATNGTPRADATVERPGIPLSPGVLVALRP
jgi:hypothetical protein